MFYNIYIYIYDAAACLLAPLDYLLDHLHIIKHSITSARKGTPLSFTETDPLNFGLGVHHSMSKSVNIDQSW